MAAIGAKRDANSAVNQRTAYGGGIYGSDQGVNELAKVRNHYAICIGSRTPAVVSNRIQLCRAGTRTHPQSERIDVVGLKEVVDPKIFFALLDAILGKRAGYLRPILICCRIAVGQEIRHVLDAGGVKFATRGERRHVSEKRGVVVGISSRR